MRKSKSEKLRDAKRPKAVKQAEMTPMGLFLLLLDGDRSPADRQANPTQLAFFNSTARVKGYMGPAGCAKTSTICAAAWMRALFVPGSKILVARNDYNDLMDTTKLRMEDMLARLPPGILLDRNKNAPEKWIVQSIPQTDPETGDIWDDPSSFTFMSLKDAKGSYEFDAAIIDEADECERDMVSVVNSRFRGGAGKRLQELGVKDGVFSLMLCFNPPPKTHWLYSAATGRDAQERKVDEPWVTLFRPQPRENTRNLPDGYYEEMASSLTAQQRTRLIDGEWGAVFPGQPVYREFKTSIHVRPDVHKKFDPHSTLYRYWDFGYNHPACLFFQHDARGRRLGMGEYMDEKVHIENFIDGVQAYTNTNFPNVKDVFDIGDPAVAQTKDTGSALTFLANRGITMHYHVMGIDEGLTLCRKRLETLIDGEAATQFDEHKMVVTIAALSGGYHMDKKGAKPVKDNYYDHPADAWRYGETFQLRGAGIDVSKLPRSIAQQGRVRGNHGYQSHRRY